MVLAAKLSSSPADLDQLVIQEEAANGKKLIAPSPAIWAAAPWPPPSYGCSASKTPSPILTINDLKIRISPEAIAINTIGGVASLAQGSEPLIIRVRSDTLHQQNRGQERCVVMHPSTGEITNGSWESKHF